MSTIAVVRVRGPVRVRKEIARALDHLNLRTRNSCSILADTLVVRGALKKVQSFVTWGTVTEETVKALEPRKHGKTYRLNPPRKGFGRKGIKLPFAQGGALGERKDKINDLLKRMV